MAEKPNFDLIHQQLKLARRQILDTLQAAYGHEPNWQNVRARILKILGRDGLEKPFLRHQSDMGYGNNNGQKKNW